MDAEKSRLLAMMKEMKKTASQPLSSELENMKSMFAAQSAVLQSQFEAERKITLDAKAKEAQEAVFEAKLEKDAQIKALTAAKTGKPCVEDDEGGDGEDEDDDEEDDDALSALTHGSKGSKGPKDPKKKSNPKTTAKDIRDAVVKEIKDHIDGQLGFIPPEVMSKKLNSPEGLLLIMANGAIWKAKIVDAGSKGKTPSIEVSFVASPPSEKSKPKSSFAYSEVIFTTKSGMVKFVTEQILVIIEMPPTADVGASVKGLLAFQAYWSLMFEQTVGPNDLIRGNSNNTQYSDSVLVACAAMSSFQAAMVSDKGLASLKDISKNQWQQAISYKGASNNQMPHPAASYMQAAGMLLMQCPHCAYVGMAETICFTCGTFPPASNLVPKPSAPTAEFKKFSEKHASLPKYQLEEKFKTENPTKLMYQDHSKSAKKPEHDKFMDYLCKHQGDIKPRSKWA